MKKVKKYVDDSFVFWTSCPEDELNLHFNAWYSRKKCWLDIGVRVCNTKRTEYIKIFLPFKIERQDIEDLYSRFDVNWIEDNMVKNCKEKAIESKQLVKNTACAIFNSNCEITIGETVSGLLDNISQNTLKNIIKIKHGQRIDYFIKLEKNIFQFEKIEKTEESSGGVLLTVDCKPFAQLINSEQCEEGYHKGFYIRFRVPHISLEKSTRKKGVYSGIITETPSRNTIIQYMQRVNERRALPYKLFEKYPYIENQYISKAMSMLAVNNKYEISDTECYKIRQLEYKLHDMYIPEGFIEGRHFDEVNVYQWKIVNKNDDSRTNSFVFNIKIQRDDTKLIDWIRYSVVGLISGAVSAFLSWIITELIIPLCH